MTSNNGKQSFTFGPDGAERLLACFDQLAAAHRGWINIRPEIDLDDEPREPGLIAGVFAFHGPQVPLGTWIPGQVGRHGVENDSVGLLHHQGQQLAKRLGDFGLTRPEGWRVVQDHPRRGVVFRVPPGGDTGVIAHWLMEACSALSTVPVTGRWTADVHSGPGR